MGKLISVTFFFENCEMFSIDGGYFGNFYVGDISTSYQRVAVNSIQEMNTANTIVMEIFSEGNGTYSCWGKWDTKFHRIMTYDDIVILQKLLLKLKNQLIIKPLRQLRRAIMLIGKAMTGIMKTIEIN